MTVYVNVSGKSRCAKCTFQYFIIYNNILEKNESFFYSFLNQTLLHLFKIILPITHIKRYNFNVIRTQQRLTSILKLNENNYTYLHFREQFETFIIPLSQ